MLIPQELQLSHKNGKRKYYGTLWEKEMKYK